jgi:hypothetical protein
MFAAGRDCAVDQEISKSCGYGAAVVIAVKNEVVVEHGKKFFGAENGKIENNTLPGECILGSLGSQHITLRRHYR